jgi:hypothetical protein
MGFYRGPKIVTDGLILALDSTSPRSYSGSGSTWYDISGNQNNFTIQGNISWSSTTGFGNFEGNSTGSGNKIYRSSFPTNLKMDQGGAGYTILMWARSTGGAGSWRKLIGNADGENYIDLYQLSSSPYGWHEDGSGDTLYVDGVSVSNNSYTMVNTGWHLYGATSFNAGTKTNPGYALTIGNEPNSSPNGANAYPWIGNVSTCLIYNRVLHTDEMLKIYNAQKTRFGL